MSNRAVSILMLEQHRENLASAQSFEEFRDRHVSFIGWLIARERADLDELAAAEEFLDRSGVPSLKK